MGAFPEILFRRRQQRPRADPHRRPDRGRRVGAAPRRGKLAIYNLGLGPQGYPGLRQFVADKSKKHRGIDVPVDDVTILTGSGQGIDMVGRLLINPGDTVLVEEFCYQGAINRFRKFGATVVGMKLDANGIVMDALADQLAGLKAQGITPKFIYTIPTIQNPTATIMPLDRRQALLKLAHQYNVPIFEDECYADLLWQGVEAPPALYALDPGAVIHLGSFSKSLAPALRLGYLMAPWEVMSRLLPLKGDSGTGALDQMIVAEYFSKNFDKPSRPSERRAEGQAGHDGRSGGARVRQRRRMLDAQGRHLPVDQAAGRGGRPHADQARRRRRHRVQPGSRLGDRRRHLQVAPAAVLRHAGQADDP